MIPTLVSIHHHELNGRQFLHGDEIVPGLLTGELLDWWIDKRWCREMPERRSLHRLFHPFSGCEERQELTERELTSYTLPS